MHFGFYVFGFQAHIVEEYMSLLAAILDVSSVSLFWLVGFTGDDAPRFTFPSGVAKPRMLVILAGMNQEDSCSGMNNAGIAGDPAPRAVFLPFVKPMMLRIMTGMHQKDSCPRCTGKLEFPERLLVFYGPLYMAVKCSVLVCLRSAYADSSGRRLPVWFPYSALFGSTVD